MTTKHLTIITTIEGGHGWIFVGDRFGDWRGINEARGLRTRLKRSLTTAQADVADNRLQHRLADGTWRDVYER